MCVSTRVCVCQPVCVCVCAVETWWHIIQPVATRRLGLKNILPDYTDVEDAKNEVFYKYYSKRQEQKLKVVVFKIGEDPSAE